jgi:catechol 2,3-dioxygenase-like lactoylglutathione lyase family enzyme
MVNGMITGLNHITLAASDLERSLYFYLGLKGHVRWDNGVCLSAGSLWLCLSLDADAISPKTDYTHVAFDVSRESYPDYVNRLKTPPRCWDRGPAYE